MGVEPCTHSLVWTRREWPESGSSQAVRWGYCQKELYHWWVKIRWQEKLYQQEEISWRPFFLLCIIRTCKHTATSETIISCYTMHLWMEVILYVDFRVHHVHQVHHVHSGLKINLQHACVHTEPPTWCAFRQSKNQTPPVEKHWEVLKSP